MFLYSMRMLYPQPMSFPLIKENNANEEGEGRVGERNGGVLSTEHYAKYILNILNSRLICRR